MTIEDAKAVMEQSGYVVLKRESYRRAQERQRVAEALLGSEKRHNEDTRAWAFRALDEQVRLSDRLTFVYGVARAYGATVEELSGE